MSRPFAISGVLLILAVLLAQLAPHSTLTKKGNPYEEWDEIGTSNDSVVLDEPETLRVYTYGSLDTFFHVVSHFLYNKFDDVGKQHLRHSYANNVTPSLNDPFLMFGPKTWEGLDYNYFRGLHDRRPVFVARKIYFGVTALLYTGLTVAAFIVFGAHAWVLVAAVFFCGTHALFVDQARLALPNAINALFAASLALLAAAALRGRKSPVPLRVAAALLALGVNMKIDFANQGLFVLLAHIGHCYLTGGGFRKFVIESLRLAGIFLALFVVTRPALLFRPIEEWHVQERMLTLLVSSQPDRAENLRQWSKYVGSDYLAVPGLPAAETLGPLLLGIAAVIALAGLFLAGREKRSAGAMLAGLAVVDLMLLWYLPVSRSAQFYPRYLLSGTFALSAFFGVALLGLMESRWRGMRTLAAALAATLVLVGAARVASLWAVSSRQNASYEATGGFDPRHSRTRAVAEAVRLIRNGEFPAEVIVDQHGYVDLRYFWLNGIQTVPVNMKSFRERLGSLERGKDRLAIFVPGDGGWSGDEQVSYSEFSKFFAAQPLVRKFEGNIMSSLSPAPVNPDEGVLLVRVSSR